MDAFLQVVYDPLSIFDFDPSVPRSFILSSEVVFLSLFNCLCMIFNYRTTFQS